MAGQWHARWYGRLVQHGTVLTKGVRAARASTVSTGVAQLVAVAGEDARAAPLSAPKALLYEGAGPVGGVDGSARFEDERIEDCIPRLVVCEVADGDMVDGGEDGRNRDTCWRKSVHSQNGTKRRGGIGGFFSTPVSMQHCGPWTAMEGGQRMTCQHAAKQSSIIALRNPQTDRLSTISLWESE